MPDEQQVYIGNVPQETIASDFKKLFQGYDIENISIKPQNYAFVTFSNRSDAREAIRVFNNCKFRGVRISVEKAKGTDWSRNPIAKDDYHARQKERERSLSPGEGVFEMVVTNLSSRCTKKELADKANLYGDVTTAKVWNDQKVGLVKFRNVNGLRRAIEKMDGSFFMDREIRCREKENSRSPSPPPKKQKKRAPSTSSEGSPPPKRKQNRSPQPRSPPPQIKREASSSSRGSPPPPRKERAMHKSRHDSSSEDDMRKRNNRQRSRSQS